MVSEDDLPHVLARWLLLAVTTVVSVFGPFPAFAQSVAALPMPLSNNAVATVSIADRQFIVSFAGLGSGKNDDDILDVTLVLDSRSGEWQEAAPLPGRMGGLAAIAASVDGLAYVFGGYTVAADGSETSTPFVHAFDAVASEFTVLSPMPVPVDDVVAVTFREHFIYLISGWHELGNVNLVQRYDVMRDSWVQATPIPGKAVFGHAGGIVGNRIVYCDGVMIGVHAHRSRDFMASDECYLGIINKSDRRRIDWRTIPRHPGLPRYRMAAAGIESLNGVLFIGASKNPYDYDGIAYNVEPSEPAQGAFLFELASLSWREMRFDGPATMDHRGLVPSGDRWLTVGGMLSNQQVTNRVVAYESP